MSERTQLALGRAEESLGHVQAIVKNRLTAKTVYLTVHKKIRDQLSIIESDKLNITAWL